MFRNSEKHAIWTSPIEETMTVITPLIKAVITCGPRKLIVRTIHNRLSANADDFAVRNNTQRAGFDKSSSLKVWRTPELGHWPRTK